MMFLLYTVHVLICFFLIAVVLLQQGKGADLSVFGGGATQTAFGARGAASVLHKLTVGSFIGFIMTTLAIGVVQSDKTSSIIQDLPAEAAVEEVAEPEGALPTDEAEEGSEATATDSGATDSPAADADASSAEEATDAGADAGSAEADAADSGGSSDEESGN